MPAFSRQALRRALGQSWLRDTYVGATTGSFAYSSFSLNILDNTQANLALSGQALYAGAWLRVAGGVAPSVQDLRVATFNVGSGAYLAQELGPALSNPIASGTSYERHELVSPADKDRALDDAVQRIRVRQEVALTALSGVQYYPLDAAASPHRITTVLDAYAFAAPGDPGDRDKRVLAPPAQAVQTGTGLELRLAGAVASGQIVLDALLELTLGAGEAATVNLPDDRLVLAAAAARCWDMLASRSPGTQTAVYEQNRDDAAAEFSRLSARYKPATARRLSPGAFV